MVAHSLPRWAVSGTPLCEIAGRKVSLPIIPARENVPCLRSPRANVPVHRGSSLMTGGHADADC